MSLTIIDVNIWHPVSMNLIKSAQDVHFRTLCFYLTRIARIFASYLTRTFFVKTNKNHD